MTERIVHDGPGHPYGDPGYCGGCWWEQVGRCPAAFTTPYGDRRCDLAAGHDGVHLRNDGYGRPEYHWATTETSPDPSGAAPPTRDH